MVAFLGLLGLAFVAASLSSTRSTEARYIFDEARVRALADKAVEQARLFLDDAASAGSISDPLSGIKDLFGDGQVTSPMIGESVWDNGRSTGTYAACLTLVRQSSNEVVVRVDATGYSDDSPGSLAPGESPVPFRAVTTTLRYALGPSEVFNYGYFINNWGWFYGDTISCNGNVRSNGQFDVAGYSPTVTGTPMYQGLEYDGSNATLTGYIDDNNDGMSDGNDGGVFAGWGITGAENLIGNGGTLSNQHDFDGIVAMPDLSDLTIYQNDAIAQGGTLSQGGVLFSDAVYGDDPGEKQNLYLMGTASDPIVLNGPVVVQGDVIIGGYVTGQGSIYTGGSVYIPRELHYLSPPSPRLPASNTQADTEAWIANNWNADFLGLFSAENIIAGDYTHSAYQSWIGSWMNSPQNKSEEDAGEDGIPNTSAGFDGLVGTPDDDVLEDDNVWSTEVFTAAHDAAGLIPSGYTVGDAIPGTGEDIDGDGQYDKGVTIGDIAIQDALNPSHWGGNLPPRGVSKYKDIASIYGGHLDAVLYTNLTFAWLSLDNEESELNGALITRNENIVYRKHLEFNYDRRLLGGGTGFAGELLPRSIQPVEILHWSRLDNDPNRHALLSP